MNELIETCKDAEQGFQIAAENVQDKDLDSLFTTYSHQRREFAGELQQEVRRLGGDPERRGSVAGTLQTHDRIGTLQQSKLKYRTEGPSFNF